MSPLDWVVMVGALVGVIMYGLWRSRGTTTLEGYLLAGKTMPWYAMALSIMATQASAITFISTTGQSYVDGMRFVQFYFGLPIAMVLISLTAVPIFHRAGVYTAYQYLEQRFDAKTRALVSVIFLLQRGLAAGVALYAPAVVLTVILGWPDQLTTLLMGTLVVGYTVLGGIRAVTWTDFQQMLIMFAGLIAAFIAAVTLLPSSVSLPDALRLAGAAGKLNPVVWQFDWNDQYNVWSGLFGGMFLALAYFGTDQSQVQRYLTGKSITQSRLSLLFNAVAKIPMQFFILLTGAMVFVFFVFERPPILFERQALARAEQSGSPAWQQVEQRHERLVTGRRSAAEAMVASQHAGDTQQYEQQLQRFREANTQIEAARREAGELAREPGSATRVNDTNYIFLTFVVRYLPAGLVGLILAMIFAAAMSTISGEINSLATVSMIDIYQRFWKPQASDQHYLRASQIATVLWGAYAVSTAQYGRSFGSLIEAVNRLGSLFYGSMLGVFVMAFFVRRVQGNGAFFGVLAGEAVVFATYQFTSISFLWFNVIGCLVTITTGLLVSAVQRQNTR